MNSICTVFLATKASQKASTFTSAVRAINLVGMPTENHTNQLFTSLDLELNQPSGKIIQVGACVGNLKTGEVIDKLSVFVKIDEPLNPDIIKLTGITEAQMLGGVSLFEAYEMLRSLHVKYECFVNPIVWGGGDTSEIKKELKAINPEWDETNWCFGRRWIDVKTVLQVYCFSRNIKLQSGLAKSLIKVGLTFEGKKHNALDDAVNTFRVAHKLVALIGVAPN